MPACATQEKVAQPPTVSNLFLPVPDTDLRAFPDEVAELARFAPEIVEAIEKDLDAHAREKKKQRFQEADARQHLGESQQQLADRREDTHRAFDAGGPAGTEA